MTPQPAEQRLASVLAEGMREDLCRYLNSRILLEL